MAKFGKSYFLPYIKMLVCFAKDTKSNHENTKTEKHEKTLGPFRGFDLS